MKTGVLILNLGTPDEPSPAKVRAYLKEFLSDPRVLDLPAPFGLAPLARWMFLNLIILPTRPRKSAEAYQKIWTKAGSPLLTNTQAFTNKLRERLSVQDPNRFVVEFAMRYGNPSMSSVLETMLSQGVDEIIVFPQYPQYASSSTGSLLQEIFRLLGKKWNIPPIRVIGSFYNEPGFLDAIVAQGLPILKASAPDHILFSYHGLPERQIRRSENVAGHCFQKDDACCAVMSEKNSFCYRAQCFETTRQLVKRMGLAPGSYTTCFQSRLGRTPWIKPYTDLRIQDLAKQGKKNIVLFSPSFVADCLETLEEISIRGLESFTAAGGKKLTLVPSLNASEDWVDAAAAMLM